MDAATDTWTTHAEAALRGLRDVEDAVINADGDDVREIHILTSSSRPPKNIVRDVQTLLITKFSRVVDHRVVSIAFVDQKPQKAPAPPPPLPAPAPPPSPAPAQAPEPAPEDRTPEPPEPAPAPAVEERIRFRSANVFVTGPRIQAQVDFHWKGLPRTGQASGHGTRDGAYRLVSQAVLHGIQDFLEDDIALTLDGVEFARVGSRDVAVVAVQLVAHREHKTLVGCCTVEQDGPQAVALATLSAVNRVLGGLPTREPTEYVLRPTSL